MREDIVSDSSPGRAPASSDSNVNGGGRTTAQKVGCAFGIALMVAALIFGGLALLFVFSMGSMDSSSNLNDLGREVEAMPGVSEATRNAALAIDGFRSRTGHLPRSTTEVASVIEPIWRASNVDNIEYFTNGSEQFCLSVYSVSDEKWDYSTPLVYDSLTDPTVAHTQTSHRCTLSPSAIEFHQSQLDYKWHVTVIESSQIGHPEE